MFGVAERRHTEAALQSEGDRQAGGHDVRGHVPRAGGGALLPLLPDAHGPRLSAVAGQPALQPAHAQLPIPQQEHDRERFPWDLNIFTYVTLVVIVLLSVNK